MTSRGLWGWGWGRGAVGVGVERGAVGVGVERGAVGVGVGDGGYGVLGFSVHLSLSTETCLCYIPAFLRAWDGRICISFPPY